MKGLKKLMWKRSVSYFSGVLIVASLLIFFGCGGGGGGGGGGVDTAPTPAPPLPAAVTFTLSAPSAAAEGVILSASINQPPPALPIEISLKKPAPPGGSE